MSHPHVRTQHSDQSQGSNPDCLAQSPVDLLLGHCDLVLTTSKDLVAKSHLVMVLSVILCKNIITLHPSFKNTFRASVQY